MSTTTGERNAQDFAVFYIAVGCGAVALPVLIAMILMFTVGKKHERVFSPSGPHGGSRDNRWNQVRMAWVSFLKYCVMEPAKLGVSVLWSHLPAVPFCVTGFNSSSSHQLEAKMTWDLSG